MAPFLNDAGVLFVANILPLGEKYLSVLALVQKIAQLVIADSKPQAIDAEHLLTLFNGKVKLPEDYYKKNKVVILPLKYGLGHPVEYHPVSDVMDPSNITKIRTQMNCMTCHQPHAGTENGMLVKDQAPNMDFCRTCHSNPLDLKSIGNDSKFGGKQ